MIGEELPPSLRQLLAGPLRQGALRQDEPLRGHSQFGVGGPADWYWEQAALELLPELVGCCRELGFPLTVLGAGSNCLILDGGIRGLVLRFPAVPMVDEGGGRVRLEAGSMLPRTPPVSPLRYRRRQRARHRVTWRPSSCCSPHSPPSRATSGWT